MKIKLCGFKTAEPLALAVARHVNYVGFVFHPSSPRYIDPNSAAELSEIVPATVDRVAVFADTDLKIIKEINRIVKPQYFQFHGNETVGFLEKIQEIFPYTKIIKAFQIGTHSDLRVVHKFQRCCDAYLFDSKNPNTEINGGSGKTFDWRVLSNFRSRKPWFLAGGINIKNVAGAYKITNAPMLDISSGIEESVGVKSTDMIDKLMEKINNLYHNDPKI